MNDTIIFGTAPDGTLVTMPRTVFEGTHLVIRGKTGSGKSLDLGGKVSQLVMPYERCGAICLDAVKYIDWGGDLFTLNFVREQCEKLGRKFRLFSLDPQVISAHFEPLQATKALAGSPSRQANFLAAGLNLVFTAEYGKSYWGRLNLSTITRAFESLSIKGVDAPSLMQVAEELRQISRRQRFTSEGSEAVYAIEQLLSYEKLSPSVDPDENIDVARAVDAAEVCYFFLPTLLEPLPARAIGTLAAWSFVIECVHRHERGLPRRTVYLVQDEFAQCVGGRSFEDTLVLSRKFGVQMILAHQTSSQLVLRDADLRPVIRDNANKLYLTATTEDDVKELLGYSMDTAKLLRGVSIQRLQSATSTREVIEPILERNDVLTVSNTFLHGYLVIDDGQGHKEPIRLVVNPPCSKAEYERLKNTPLPRYAEGAKAVHMRRAAESQIPGADRRRLAAAKLLESLKSEEAWEIKNGGQSAP